MTDIVELMNIIIAPRQGFKLKNKLFVRVVKLMNKYSHYMLENSFQLTPFSMFFSFFYS